MVESVESTGVLGNAKDIMKTVSDEAQTKATELWNAMKGKSENIKNSAENTVAEHPEIQQKISEGTETSKNVIQNLFEKVGEYGKTNSDSSGATSESPTATFAASVGSSVYFSIISKSTGTYIADWGDGSKSEGAIGVEKKTISHVWKSAGSYSVSLKILENEKVVYNEVFPVEIAK